MTEEEPDYQNILKAVAEGRDLKSNIPMLRKGVLQGVVDQEDAHLAVLQGRKHIKRVGELTDRIVISIQDLGYEVIDPKEFFTGIDRYYRKPSIETVIKEETPQIIAADPTLLERNQISLEGVSGRLRQLYDKAFDRASYGFKVWLRHVRFFLIDHPNQEELRHAVDELKKVLDGRETH